MQSRSEQTIYIMKMLDFEIKHSRLDNAEKILKGIAAHTLTYIHIPISIKL